MTAKGKKNKERGSLESDIHGPWNKRQTKGHWDWDTAFRFNEMEWKGFKVRKCAHSSYQFLKYIFLFDCEFITKIQQSFFSSSSSSSSFSPPPPSFLSHKLGPGAKYHLAFGLSSVP